jgi:hypothetical protein
MTNLPKWIEEIRHPPLTPKTFTIDEMWKVFEALSIAYQALEGLEKNCSNHSGISQNAMRRIEELGK